MTVAPSITASRGKRHLTDEGVREIARRLRAGEARSAIIAAFGLERSGGYRLLRRVTLALDIEPEDVRWRRIAAEIEQVAHLPVDEIAAELGITVSQAAWQRQKFIAPDRRHVAPLTAVELAEIDRRFLAGESTGAIARAIGCSQGTVWRRTAAQRGERAARVATCACGRSAGHTGICPPHGETLDQVQRLVAERASTAEIAAALGVSASTAWRYARRYREPQRDKAAAAGPRSRPPRHRTSSAPGSRLAPSVRRRMQAMYDMGQQAAAIAEGAGVSLDTAKRYVRHRKAKSRSRKTCVCGRPAAHPGSCSASRAGSLTMLEKTRIETSLRAGMKPADVAAELGLHPETVARHSVEVRAALVREGATCACGRVFGHSGVCKTAPHLTKPPAVIAADITRAVVGALVGGRRDADIRASLSISQTAIAAIRKTLDPVQRARRHAALALTDEALIARIGQALPSRIGQPQRDEIVSDLFTGFRAGHVELNDLRQAGRRILQRAFFDRAHAAPSLDARLTDDGNATLGDMIEDGTAAAQIEQMEIGR